jgi:hypothetical protein
MYYLLFWCRTRQVVSHRPLFISPSESKIAQDGAVIYTATAEGVV